MKHIPTGGKFQQGDEWIRKTWENTRMTHVMNILVDGWKKPRGKLSVKYTEILVAL